MTKSEWYAKLQAWAFDDPRLNRMPLIFLDPLAELLANDQAVEHSVHSDALYEIVERKFPCQSCGATNTIRVPIARR